MEHIFCFEELDQMIGDYAPFLVSLSDGIEGELRMLISAAGVGETGGNLPYFEGIDNTIQHALNGILANTKPLELNEKCLFEICFDNYIIYQIRNESFCSYDPNEIRHGKHLVVFEKSKMLSHLDEITDVQQFDDGSYYPDKWTHYGIYTQNHVIDVISHRQPAISCYIQ